MKYFIFFLLSSISLRGQEKSQQEYFPFYDNCTNEKKFSDCEREILEKEILNFITPEIQKDIIDNLKNDKAVLTFAFVYQNNKPIREDIDIDFSNNELKEKLKNFLLQLKPLTKNDSIDDSLKVRHFEFVFLTNKSKKKLFIANERKLKEINHKSEFKFGSRPMPAECQNSEDINECVNQFMNNHIKKYFNYPEVAIDKGIQGKVKCLFTINDNGGITIKELDGPSFILEKEAERIIKKLPNFIPGTIKGIPTKFSISIPISFVLE
jgi:TonB family protein